MKKHIGYMLAVGMVLCLLLPGCGPKGTFSVSFNGEAPITVTGGDKLTAPEAPEKEGYTFQGWFYGPERNTPWNFDEDKVSSDMALYPMWDMETTDEMTEPSDDKDFSAMKSPGSQELAYEYTQFFLPAVDGIKQPYVGDPMPYYEDGVYYIYYLKEGGDSYNHSIYLTTTKDFITYEEQEEPVLEASRSGGQDAWIGTGSVVKVEDTYYLFYTGHTGADSAEFKEKIMVAQSDNLQTFTKIDGWEITPPAELGQKNDFRDPQAYYDPETKTIGMTITAAQSNVARILKYSVAHDLSSSQYDGIIYTNEIGSFWNLECSDTFCIGDTWYLTYSGQDDTLWYVSGENRYGPYTNPTRLDGKLFYAAKHVDDGENAYMVGWARRSESVSSTQDVGAWAGNLIVQKLVQKENGALALVPVDAIAQRFTNRRNLLIDTPHIYTQSEEGYAYYDVFTCYERFMLTGEFTYTGKGTFGLAFDFNKKADKHKLIAIDPENQSVKLLFNQGETLITEAAVELQAGESYSFTYIQEGSVGTFYIGDQVALTVRIYGASGKPIRLFAENNAVQFTSLRQYS